MHLRGILGLALILLVAWLCSRHRRGIRWRTVLAALAIQWGFAALVLRWSLGRDALKWVADQVAKLINYTHEGTDFVFGPLLRVTRIESFYASTVIFLGQSEAPLMISPHLASLRRSQLFTVMTAGFAAVAGSTLVGYALLGAPLTYLLAASVMNAPSALLIAKIMWPDDEPAAEERVDEEVDVREIKDEESSNVIDALARGAIAGGKIAVTVGALLIAFIAVIALANGILGGIGGWFGYASLTFQKLLGWILSPVAWVLGVPWHEAIQAGSYIGQKTVLNEFLAYSNFGPDIPHLSSLTVVIVTFALAGFANFASVAIQIGTIGSLAPDRRSEVAALGLRALLAGSLANLANAAIAGVVAVT